MIAAVTKGHQPVAPDAAGLVPSLRSLAIRALARMYRPGERLFAFRLRRDNGKDVLEGASRRYTAIALIGLAGEARETIVAVLGDHSLDEICGRLLDHVEEFEDLGEVALTTWAARRLDHPDVSKAIDRLRRMDPANGSYPTVESSWALTALASDGSETTDMALAEAVAQRLLSSFNPQSSLFPHWPQGARPARLRGHVTCFADFVYPVQALSHYYLATGTDQAVEVARRCAQRMCQLQGTQGQWWWHFDVRTGRVVERFPVYSVHQDSMAPMAFSALRRASGQDYSGAVKAGLRWLASSPEIKGSLIDRESDVVWRKVARHEPGKLVRGLQAAASRLAPRLRVPGTDLLFRPGWIDYESRPYHMGWVLCAWPVERAAVVPQE